MGPGESGGGALRESGGKEEETGTPPEKSIGGAVQMLPSPPQV